MATTETIKKSVTFTFTDNSTRKVTVGNFAGDGVTYPVLNAFKAGIKQFNDSDVTKLQTVYFSNVDDEGRVFPVKEISAADITYTAKTPIYAVNDAALMAAINEEG